MKQTLENPSGRQILNKTSDKQSSCQRICATKVKNVSQITFTYLCLVLTISHCSALEEQQIMEPAIGRASYEEFKLDHEVSQQEANEALRKLNATHAGTLNSCSSLDCSEVYNYCWGEQFDKDHCWCELQHREEGLPYKPHKCFVEGKIYTTSVGSCFHFEEVKECCCVSAFLREWRRISAASLSTAQPFFCSLLTLISLLHWRSRRR